MSTFLGQSAYYIFSKYPLSKLQDLQIVLPSRRAVLYFKNELAAMSAIPFIAPKIVSIDDFVQELSGLQALENIELYFEIFEIWQKYDNDQTLERFLTWVPTLLADFNLIDSALLEKPQLLFKYMSEAEALSRWDLNDHEFSAGSLSYFTFFDKMGLVYEELKTKLLSSKKSYSGFAYRTASEKVNSLLDKSETYYYFVGLNALSIAEEQIIETLVKANIAECLWDTDSFYMDAKNKAGKKLRGYKSTKRFGKEWLFQENELLTGKKEMVVFEAGSKVEQSKIALELISNSNSKSQVLVVLDQSDFMPLMVQLPALDKKFNITAGLAFSASELYAVFDVLGTILEQPNNKKRNLKMVLANPVISKLLREELEEKAFQEIVKPEWDGKVDGLLKLLLEIDSIPNYLLATRKILKEYRKFDMDGFSSVLLDKLDVKLLENRAIGIAAFKLVLTEIFKTVSLPFEKEPDATVQVMSLLETRCLDFDEVTFISFQEGNLPSGKKNNSFMPFDAAKFFNLPLYSDQDAIMAYHFFRLLQRAKKVNILYPKDTGSGVGMKEASRFLFQIENELLTKNLNISLERKQTVFEGKQIEKPEIIIQKNDRILARAKNFFENRGLSPTSINEYFRSPLGFYWKYIERISSKVNDSDEIGADVFGSIIHYVLEMIEKPYFGTKTAITKEILLLQKKNAIHDFDLLLKESQPDFDFNLGLNVVLKSVIKELLAKYYDRRITEFSAPYHIIGIENAYEVFLDIAGIKLKVTGKIDKMEQQENVIRVIDFKTGKVEKAKIQFDFQKDGDLLKVLEDGERDKFRQLLVYYFLIHKEFDKNTNFEFRFYSFRNLNDNLILKLDNVDKEEVLLRIQEMLAGLVSEIMDKNKPLSHDKEKEVFEYSDYYDLLTLQ